jgi:hypothetical protein
LLLFSKATYPVLGEHIGFAVACDVYHGNIILKWWVFYCGSQSRIQIQTLNLKAIPLKCLAGGWWNDCTGMTRFLLCTLQSW